MDVRDVYAGDFRRAFTSGFLSKDEILAGTLAYASLTGQTIIPIVGFLVAGLTAFYMFRVVILTFLGTHKDSQRAAHLQESPAVMTVPLIILAVLSVFVVFSFNPFNASGGWIARAIERPLSVVPEALAAPGKEVFEEALHHAHGTAIALSLLVAGIGILAAYATYYWKKISADAVAARLAPVHGFLMNKWGFDDLYNTVVVGGTLAFTRGLRWVDDTIIDGTVNGAGWLTTAISFVSGKFDAIVVDGIVNLTAYLSGFIGLVFPQGADRQGADVCLCSRSSV